MPINLRTLCLVTLVLCNVHGSLEHEIPRRSFLSRRAIDGTRGRKYFDPQEEGGFDSYGSAGGQYDPYEEKTDLSDIRRNVPGEPGIDYPAYTTLPQTGFTCEGRSRGYYADEVSGCQVFHVCHDVLVSSFLCPIGSIFSQKLLTCDWWTKVDCSSTVKYIDVNRNSYQQDDDEMIRNAYAMISLQSGTDVTKDGLVDPDRTGSVIDYHRGTGRINDYSTVDTTGNDLRNGFEDYPESSIREFLPNYDQYQNRRKPDTSRNYQIDRSRAIYQDSPIIRIQKIEGYGEQGKKNDGSYRGPNEFTNQFQPSYAPTVPTVTTTTRRFYSPTVPTTYRPSTLAYSKLDQIVDSSDNYYSQSKTKSFVTPPTRIFPSDNKRHQSLEELRRAGFLSSRKTDRDEDYNQEESVPDQNEDIRRIRGRNNRPRTRFEVRVPDFQLNRTNLYNNRSPSQGRTFHTYEKNRDDDEGDSEDIHTRGSIGLGHALRQSHRRISIQKQDPVGGKSKNEGEYNSAKQNSSTPYKEDGNTDYQYTLRKPDSVGSLETSEEEEAEQYDRDAAGTTTTSYESQEYTVDFDLKSTSKYQESTEGEENDDPNVFVPSTTPSFVESTIEATTRSSTQNVSLEYPIIQDEKIAAENHSSSLNSRSFNEGDSLERSDYKSHILRPADFLKPPLPVREQFRINVPDPLPRVTSILTRYSATDNEPYRETATTEIPSFQSTYPDVETTTFAEKPSTEDTKSTNTREINFSNYPTTKVPSSNIPVTEIVPPVLDYNDDPSDLVTSDKNLHSSLPAIREEHRRTNYSSFTQNDSNLDILEQFSTKLLFNVRDSIPGKYNTKAPCSSSGLYHGQESCEGSVIGNKKSGTIPVSSSYFNFERANQTTAKATPAEGTALPDSFLETVTSKPSTVTLSTIGDIGNFEPLASTSRTFTQRYVTETSVKPKENNNEKGIFAQTSTPPILFESLRPETLKQIEETIEKNNSPYQISLTVNGDEELTTIGDDIISRLIAQHERSSSKLDDKIDHFEVIKSLEPEITTAANKQISKSTTSETHRNSLPEAKFTGERIGRNFSATNPNDTKRLDSNANTLSLLQLMAELLKLDRIPRPFAVPDVPDSEIRSQSNPPRYDHTSTTNKPPAERLQVRTITRDIESNRNLETAASTVFPDSAIGSRTSRPILKEELLERLKENFGQPLYPEDQPLSFDLPQVQRSTDFRTGFTLVNPNYNEPSRTAFPTTATAYVEPSTTTPKPITTTTESQKEIVKTEFVPSIGFSFDTSEGREEYVEAVLGGLIDAEGNRKQETTTLDTIDTFTRNETSRII